MPHRSDSLFIYQKTKIFTFNSMLRASLKNAQVTGLILCPFLNIWQSHVALSVQQNKWD